MVTWKLLGEKMPRNETEWEEEFKKYQEFPEFKMLVFNEFYYIEFIQKLLYPIKHS